MTTPRKPDRTASDQQLSTSPTGQPADQPTAELAAEQIAQLAAHQAMLVPGVVRLQPGLRHAVGRAARALFSPGGPGDDQSAADGVDVRIHPDPQVALRIVTTTDPTPRVTAAAVQQHLTDVLRQVTGESFRVVVVIVDVETEPDGATGGPVPT